MAVGGCAGVVGFGVVVWFRGALDDAVEFEQVGEGEDEGDVEDFGAVDGVLAVVVLGMGWKLGWW